MKRRTFGPNYCRPIDPKRKLMVAVAPNRYVNARAALRLGLLARRSDIAQIARS